MFTFIKAAKVTKLCVDKLYVTGLRFVKFCHVTGAGEEYDPKQQARAKFIDNMSISLLYSMLNSCLVKFSLFVSHCMLQQ